MPKFEYVYDYRNNDLLRSSFNNLAQQSFGIDFEKWYRTGFWDERFICHSMAHEGRIVSNISITRMNLVINKQEIDAIQIGTIMTHPDYRMSGLAKTLMNKVMEEYKNKCSLMYLFPGESVMKLYPKFGFSLWNDYKYSMVLKNNDALKTDLKKIDINNKKDLSRLIDIATSRVLLSSKFDFRNATSFFMWHCFNAFEDKIYLLESENVIVIYEEKNNAINLYDIVSLQHVNFHNIICNITNKDKAKVIFHFTPDFIDINANELTLVKNECMYIKPANYLAGKLFAHPIVAHA